MNKIQELLTKNIKDARKKLGYSQLKLAELCDISPSFIGEIESGKKFPSSTTLEKISDALGLEPSQLFSDVTNTICQDRCRVERENFMKIYPDEFKAEVAKKHLLPGGKSVAVLSREVGVSEQSIRNWIYKFSNGITVNNNFDFNLTKISDSEKLNLLLESKSIPEDDRGVWLREKGLKTEHIKLWEEQMKEKISNKQDALREENKKLKEEVKNLQNELQRKEKALAEMSSMLMLKKNYRSLISGEED